MSGGPKLTHKQEALIASLLTHPTVAQARTAVGIAEATATRWLKDPTFAKAYATARREALREAMTCLQQGMLAAVDTLRAVMLADETPPAVKVSAAKTVLEMGLRTFEIEDHEARITALEAAQR
jgi:hypothetical protein